MIEAIQFGFGDIGQRLFKYLYEREGLSINAVIDPDMDRSMEDIEHLTGNEDLDINPVSEIDDVEGIEQVDIAIISSGAELEKAEKQIMEVAAHGLDMITTCEELVYPWKTYAEKGRKIDRYCKKRDVTCLATGLNPGFLMDYLPSVLTTVCGNVDFIKVERILDASSRSETFRENIGVGLSAKQFDENRKNMYKPGLKSSIYMLADSLNFNINKVDENLEPVWADHPIQNDKIRVKQGQVSGIEQVAYGFRNNTTSIELIYRAAVDVDESYDSIDIVGDPDFTSKIEGGINGDVATPALLVNNIDDVLDSESGLITLQNIPGSSYTEHF